ncbi:MAG TPA: transcriptional repressor [Dehalococcoidales bacterium]|nr:transcriptional repressor [Dehalococcoidales bacterium]
MVKKTRQKELILRVLRSNPFHPTAVSIYDEVRKEMPHISLATVYRNLRLFTDMGEISELEISGGLSRFEVRTDNHGHFWCNTCESVFDIEMIDKELNGRVAREKGFEVSNYRLVLRGLCPDCQPARQADTISSLGKEPEE